MGRNMKKTTLASQQRKHIARTSAAISLRNFRVSHCFHFRCVFSKKGMLKSIFLIFYVSLYSTTESDDYMLSNILHLSVPKT